MESLVLTLSPHLKAVTSSDADQSDTTCEDSNDYIDNDHGGLYNYSDDYVRKRSRKRNPNYENELSSSSQRNNLNDNKSDRRKPGDRKGNLSADINFIEKFKNLSSSKRKPTVTAKLFVPSHEPKPNRVSLNKTFGSRSRNHLKKATETIIEKFTACTLLRKFQLLPQRLLFIYNIYLKISCEFTFFEIILQLSSLFNESIFAKLIPISDLCVFFLLRS
jgi:hypothetical protein